jgi:nitric oxide dioxygenase
MLSATSKQIIATTLPAVGAHVNRITEVFYPLMFKRYPEVKAFFNQAHQAEGTQPRALANAVVAYASNLDRLEVLGDAVTLIVQKHASLNIQPEHYPIVGECLLAAIKEVLGDAATDEVLGAWAEAYFQLADILISAEENVYSAHEKMAGGWRGEREFIVTKKVPESAVITSFYLEPSDGGAIADFQPGQYIGLSINIKGEAVRRNYSLSEAPGQKYYRISVKREPGGVVSGYLHDQVTTGSVVKLTMPCGDFVLNSEQRPLVLLSGGVGITPTIAMLKPALDSGRQVHFLHGALNSENQAFADLLTELNQSYSNLHSFVCYSNPLPQDKDTAQGFFDRERLASLVPDFQNCDVYFLGPKAFMRSCYRALNELKIPQEQIRYEFFGPLEDLQHA